MHIAHVFNYVGQKENKLLISNYATGFVKQSYSDFFLIVFGIIFSDLIAQSGL